MSKYLALLISRPFPLAMLDGIAGYGLGPLSGSRAHETNTTNNTKNNSQK